MAHIFDIAKERPDPTLNMDNITCPYCGSNDVKETSGYMTCVAYRGVDMNHRWHGQVCSSFCRKETPAFRQGRNCEHSFLKIFPKIKELLLCLSYHIMRHHDTY